jgi:hypothetical protein
MLRCGHLVQPNIFNKVEITRTHQVTLPLQVHTHAIIDECLLVGAAVGQVGGDNPEVMPTPLHRQHHQPALWCGYHMLLLYCNLPCADQSPPHQDSHPRRPSCIACSVVPPEHLEAFMPWVSLPASSINLPAYFGCLEEGNPGFL